MKFLAGDRVRRLTSGNTGRAGDLGLVSEVRGNDFNANGTIRGQWLMVWWDGRMGTNSILSIAVEKIGEVGARQ